ncbi:MAG: hypothetical protein L6R38_001455 [Xanthoria sp. 2 TBL-2021]|nr:MAG: hypothetical protein L6R38_001455 [Xanthoria sp. 2 TBL-2021]
MPLSETEIQYQLKHVEDNRVNDIVVSNSVCIGLAAIAVLLRFAARRLSKAKVGADDYMVTAALVWAIGQITAGLLTIHFGGAKHAITLTEPVKFAKAVITVELFYCIAIASVKWSCLLLYRRLFPTRGFQNILWAVAVFIGLYTAIQGFLVVFQCKPIKAAWDTSIKAECINLSAMSIVTASLNVATDIVTLTLPLPLIWRLQLPRAQRLQVCGIFLLGSL